MGRATRCALEGGWAGPDGLGEKVMEPGKELGLLLEGAKPEETEVTRAGRSGPLPPAAVPRCHPERW